jgi:hypothetical protein
MSGPIDADTRFCGRAARVDTDRPEIAAPNFPVSGQRAEIAKVENSSPSGPRVGPKVWAKLGPNIAFPFWKPAGIIAGILSVSMSKCPAI